MSCSRLRLPAELQVPVNPARAPEAPPPDTTLQLLLEVEPHSRLCPKLVPKTSPVAPTPSEQTRMLVITSPMDL